MGLYQETRKKIRDNYQQTHLKNPQRRNSFII
jgi:hypothetical protein